MDKLTVEQVVSARLPTVYGQFDLKLYANNRDNKEHQAWVMGAVSGQENVCVRVHSECFTGDLMGSARCDCGEQLQVSQQKIAEQGAGVLIYLRQEGRGIGLREKLKAYNLQDQGYDTVEANLMLGHPPDKRDYTIAALIIKDLGLQSIRLLTNNPKKIQGLRDLGIIITERIDLIPTITPENERYLQTKATRLNHKLDLPPHE